MTGMTLKAGYDCGSRPARTTTTSSFNNSMCIIAISTRSRLRVGSHSKMKDFPEIDSLYQMAGCQIIMQEPFPNKHILSKERFHPIWYPWDNLLRDKDRVSCRAKLTSVAIRAIEEWALLIKLNLGCYVDGSAPRARPSHGKWKWPIFYAMQVWHKERTLDALDLRQGIHCWQAANQQALLHPSRNRD